MAETEQPGNVTTVPDVETTTTLGKEFGLMDNWTKSLVVTTLLCTVFRTLTTQKDTSVLDKVCAVKSGANLVNSLRRGLNPGMGLKALKQFAALEGFQFASPTLASLIISQAKAFKNTREWGRILQDAQSDASGAIIGQTLKSFGIKI